MPKYEVIAENDQGGRGVVWHDGQLRKKGEFIDLPDTVKVRKDSPSLKLVEEAKPEKK